MSECTLELEYQSKHGEDLIKTYHCETHDVDETIISGKLQICRIGKVEEDVARQKDAAARREESVESWRQQSNEWRKMYESARAEVAELKARLAKLELPRKGPIFNECAGGK